MPATFRVATFNAENLFDRATVLTLENRAEVDKKLAVVEQLRTELQKPVYDKKVILDLFNQVKDYIIIREDRGNFWKGQGYKAIKADGAKDWDGAIVFKTESFARSTRKNTARVIKELDADILCLDEIEDKPTLEAFNSQLLNSKYPCCMLVDAFDLRGIDVALYSKYPLGKIVTHMYDEEGKKRIFSRDCLDVDVQLPSGQWLHVLCNHLKSRGYGSKEENDAKRKRQAQRVADIIKEKYDPEHDLLIVAGDFNDAPESDALQPLLTLPGIADVLQMQFPNSPEERWTYHYKKNEQIDFILVSRPLQQGFSKAGVLRRGMFGLEKYSKGKETPYPTVTGFPNAASDHGAVWADFSLA